MSRFFSGRYASLVPYTPGEQPQDKKYIKLNTNESPYPPTESVIKAVHDEAVTLRLYSDPDSKNLVKAASEVFGVPEECIIMNNGSDETLNFAFMAFADEKNPLAFADITYGFYPVFADLNHIPYTEIPLKDDFTIDINDYIGINKTVVIANPNAPTGIALPLCDIEKIVASNPDNLVIVDEAYVDFGGESAIKLTQKYNNLLVVGTFSKSRSMAGARLGFGIACPEIIRDMNTIKYSTNPYNVNRLTSAAGIAAFKDNEIYMANCRKIAETREFTKTELEKMGFEVLPSKSNFLFAQSDKIDGERLYLELKIRGILIRHFTKEKIKNFNRITIGTPEDMNTFIETVKSILNKKTDNKTEAEK